MLLLLFLSISLLFIGLTNGQFDCNLLREQGLCGQLNSACQNNQMTKTTVDFLLIIDGSSSMADNIAAVRNGLINFANDIGMKNVDPNWMVVQYGMYPEITLDWTKNTLLVADVLGEINAGKGNYFERTYANAKTHPPSESILVHDNHDCFCGNQVPIGVANAMRNFGNCGPCPCNCGTKEAPWEVVLMALCEAYPKDHANGNCTMNRHPQSKTAKLQGPIKWNVGEKGEPSQKFAIILTDEDADCPFWTGNRAPGTPGNCKEPPSSFPRAKTGSNLDFWVDEMEKTAAAILKHDMSLQMFVNRGAGPARNQFGDPALQVQNSDFSNFDAAATLARLQGSSAAGSMQARLLEGQKQNPLSKATYRVYDVDNVVPDRPDVVSNFFREVGGAIKEQCAFKKKRDAEADEQFSGMIVGCIEYSCTTQAGCSEKPLCGEGCDQCQIDGKCYKNGEPNPADGCQQCDTTKSKISWSPCNDYIECTDDTCPAGKCVFTPRCVPECGLCNINGQCVARKEYKDAMECEWCLPEVNPTSWCGTGFCANVPACVGDMNAAAKCNNMMLDEGEEQVDCGGACKPCVSCNNGVLDGTEQGIDCGPDCPSQCMGNAPPHCFNQVQDQAETGVDCGGPCAACGVGQDGSCQDGVKQASELGVDCGGRCSNPCTGMGMGTCSGSASCFDGVQNQGEQGLDCGGPCLACSLTEGSCADNIQNGNEQCVDGGGRCAAQKQCPVQSGPRAPSCIDNLFNQNEEGIDCGGNCQNSCPPGVGFALPGTCTDSKHNNQEQATDCGGPNCPACDWASMGVQAPSCQDGIWNNGEQGLDCGGTCPTACPAGTGAGTGTCSDGIQNQGELGIDCWGPNCPSKPCTFSDSTNGPMPVVENCSADNFNFCASLCDFGVLECKCQESGTLKFLCAAPLGENSASTISISLLLSLLLLITLFA